MELPQIGTFQKQLVSKIGNLLKMLQDDDQKPHPQEKEKIAVREVRWKLEQS